MRTRRGWGEAVSPELHGNRLVIMWDQEDDSKIFVLNSDDGEIVWEQPRNEPTTWATPLIVEHSGRKQLITNGTNAVRSYDLETGDLIWETVGTTLNAIPCPIQVDQQVICMAGYRGNRAFSIDLQSQGKVAPQQLNWDITKNTPYVPSPTVFENRLYFTKANSAILSCVDVKTGDSLYSSRLDGLANLYASPIIADGKVFIPSREGVTAVVKDGEEFQLLATNTLDDNFDASPVAVDDSLLLRGFKHLYCIRKTE